MKLTMRTGFFLSALLFTLTSIACTPVAIAATATPPAAIAQGSGAMRTDSPAPDISGKWRIFWTGKHGRSRHAVMTIKQKGKKFHGSFSGERGSIAMRGTLKGDNVSFSVQGPRRSIRFTGRVSGGQMVGTTRRGINWTATRQ